MAIFLLVFFLLMIAYGLRIDAYRRAWNALPVYITEPEKLTIRVSVVIAIRNEEATLDNLFASLSQQDYSKEWLEFIFIDDHSTDRSWELLQKLDWPGIVISRLQMPAGLQSKKGALETGIRKASGELIITTDADCIHPKSWISTIVSFYHSTDSKFIAAPVSMSGGKSFLNIFQGLDVLTLQGITGAAVSTKMHALCNGANLAYPKQVFVELGGFEGIDNIPSGDDIFLMQKVIRKYPDKVFYLKAKEAIVETQPEKKWGDFFNQRIRWASKAVHYEDKNIFSILLVTYLTNCCFVVLTVAAVWNTDWAGFLLLLLVAKIIIEFPFVNSVSMFFGRQRLMKYFIVMQPVHIVYTIIAGWLGRFGSYHWKSRRIKNLRKQAA